MTPEEYRRRFTTQCVDHGGYTPEQVAIELDVTDLEDLMEEYPDDPERAADVEMEYWVDDDDQSFDD